MRTYRITTTGSKQVIEYSGGAFDGMKEQYYGEVRDGYIDEDEPNWNGLTQALKGSNLMGFAYQYAVPNGFNLFTKTLTDGENNSASEFFLKDTIGYCFPPGYQYQLSGPQKQELNGYLTANNFTIQVT